MNRFVIATVLCAAAGLLAAGKAAFADEAEQEGLHIDAQPLSSALREFSEQTGLQIGYAAELAEGKATKGVAGVDDPEMALDTLLASSGLEHRFVNAQTVVIRATETSFADEEGSSDSGNAATTPRPVMMAQASQSLENAAEDEETESNQSSSSNEAEDLKLEEIVVVGSRLGSSPVESVLPVKLITRAEIDRSGAGTIAQVLSHLPEVSVNNIGDTTIGGVSIGNFGGTNAGTVQLRGLPVGTTLVLINGRRAGESSAFTSSGVFDLSSIPLALVERIEVLPAGASAAYGGDGLAGVINIVLRRDASGFEVRGRHTAADGYGESQASVLWGKAWSRGSLTATANWSENSALTSTERSLTADQDFTRFGGSDFRLNANPGNVYSLEGCPPAPAFCIVPLEQRGDLPGLDAPVAAVPAGQDGQSLMPGDFAGTAGALNRNSRDFNFFSPEESYSLGLNGSVQVTQGLELFTEWTYTRRDLPAAELPLTSELGEFGGAGSVVPASNPFNPFGVDVGVNYFFEDTGIFTDFSQTLWRALLGARGRLKQWDWELSGWRVRDSSSAGDAGGFDDDLITEALSSSDPTTALNPFVGDGSAPRSPDLLASLIGLRDDNFSSELRAVNGFVRGPLIKLPAGEVLVLVGSEYQKQTFDWDVRSFVERLNRHVEGSTTSRAVFGEVRVPVLASRNPERWERMALTGAFRREASDRFESDATTETLGLELRPVRSLLLRATYSTAFKPLLAFRANNAPEVFNSFIRDPQFGGEFFIVESIGGGGIPAGLEPERSATRTLGLVYSPTPDWRVSVTHWDSRLRDRIAALDTQFVVDHEAELPGRVVRDPVTGVITQIDDRSINIGITEVAGVDLALDGRWHTRYGDLIPSLAATYTYKHEEQLAPASPVQDNLAIRRPIGWSPRWKIVPRLGWDYQDRVYATLTGRYVSAYEDSLPLSSSLDAGTFLTLGDFWMFDLNVDFNVGRWLAADSAFFSGTRLNIGATNLFNRLPDFCNSCFFSGYDASQYDIRGRSVYAELRFSF